MGLTDNSKPGFYYGYVIVAASLIIMVMIWGTWSTFGIFFESLLVEFGRSRAITSGVEATGNIVFGLLCIVSTRLSEKFGIRKLVTACGFFLGLGYLLMSRVTSIWQVYLFLALVIRLGMSAYIAVISVVAKWFDSRRGMMTGIVFTGLGLGVTILPPLARWLISSYEWRNAYIIIGVTALVVTTVVAQFLKDPPHRIDQLTDVEDRVGEKGLLLEEGISARRGLVTRQFWMIGVLYVIFLACLTTITVHVVIHATGLGVNAARAANILAIVGVLSIVGNNVIGTASDKIGNKMALTTSFIFMSVALFLILIAKDVWALYLFAAVFGFSFGGMQVVFSPIIAELFGLRAHGVLLAAANFIGQIGAAGGPVVSGYIYDAMNSYNMAFIICAGMSVIAVAITLLLRPVGDIEKAGIN